MNPMVKSEVRSPLREVRLRVATCFALIMLSNDEINPVKVFCDTLNIPTYYATLTFTVAFFVIVVTNASELAYFSTKVFFHSVLSIFFSSMEVLGRENIPQHGPVIFTGNHMNQFVDGAVVIVTNPRRVGTLVAEKSYNMRVIGDFCKAAGAIPVSRPQDAARAGPGKIMLEGLTMRGEGTQFTAIRKGEKVRPGRSPDAYRVAQVISDTEALLAEDYGEASPTHDLHAQGKLVSYDLLKSVDQSTMFGAVQRALADGKCLGIFPEGGSHDRTDLLPLKAGVAAIALGVMDQHNISVPIVPVGLNYFRGHRFRGRVVVEFGEPIHISKETLEVYRTSKRQGYQALLHDIEDGMRSVIVTASDYAELKLIHTARRLYPLNPVGLPTKTKQDLARRFSLAYRILREQHEGQLPQDVQDLQAKLTDYQDRLDHWGLKDYQLQGQHVDVAFNRLLYTFLHGLVIISLASIPSLLLNFPVGVAAHYWAEAEARKDLKASRVKLAARDVLLSKKIQFSLIAVPVLWVVYALLMTFLTTFRMKTIAVLILCCPFFSYLGVMAVEASMVDLKDLRPAFLRLLPEFRAAGPELQRLRQSLQKDVRAIVQKYGPELGAVYADRSFKWEQAVRKQLNAKASESNKVEPEQSVRDEERRIDTSISVMNVEVSDDAEAESEESSKKDQ